MAHYSRVYTAVIDVPDADHPAELAFWRGATGWELPQFEQVPEFHGSRAPHGHFALLVQHLGEGAPRVHLDFHTSDLEAEASRLEKLGAVRVERTDRWWIMRDPAGLPFCVIQDPPGMLDDTNAQRWD
ncbi:VOC family protein [Streptosporangium sp. CA-135522]|uniref:VOC family protein n=1 Tax=Streptosporangium sp. CA-135522 TaxID=3240072 RepID=UPI003D8A9A4E